MARYVRRFSRIGHSLGPSEERAFVMWAGYDLSEPDPALEALGYVLVDDWPAERVAELQIAAFKPATAEELKRWKI